MKGIDESDESYRLKREMMSHSHYLGYNLPHWELLIIFLKIKISRTYQGFRGRSITDSSVPVRDIRLENLPKSCPESLEESPYLVNDQGEIYYLDFRKLRIIGL